MTINAEIEAEIIRLTEREHWRVGTIAKQLRVHHSVVVRVLAQRGMPQSKRQYSSMLTPYFGVIKEVLDKYPKLPASRLFDMMRDRGYKGGPDYFRHMIASIRPRQPAEAYLRLRTLQGEQAQVDWADAGYVQIGRARRKLMFLVITLSYSREIFLYFFLGAHMENFLRGHVMAFNKWQGLPRILLYDNLKSLVTERQGKAILFNRTLVDLASHYRIELRPVAPGRGNEKGRVERAIGFIRTSFLAGRQYKDLDDLNTQAQAWCETRAADRQCPEDRAITVREAFELEKPFLQPLPATEYQTEEHVSVKVGKTPYVRFDLNDYSVPATYVRCSLNVRADLKQVRVFEGTKLIATHERSFSSGEQIEIAEHIEQLWKQKQAASEHRGIDRLLKVVPLCQLLLTKAADEGMSIRSTSKALQELLDRYGGVELQAALESEIKNSKDLLSISTVHAELERRRIRRGAPAPIVVDLPEHVRRKDVTVKLSNLSTYDQLLNDHQNNRNET
jgi:transposase